MVRHVTGMLAVGATTVISGVGEHPVGVQSPTTRTSDCTETTNEALARRILRGRLTLPLDKKPLHIS